jgi:hypothetical protein
MTGFIIVMTPPDGRPEYWPEGFGFTSHAHATERAQAEIFPDEVTAWQRANGYRWPPAFWNSERAHRERIERRFRNWTFAVEPEPRP